jgi:hypothetical protein
METPNLHHRRYTFLKALRYGPVPFWQSLHEVWQTRNPDRQQIFDAERFRIWLASWRITDRWFIDDAIIPTLNEWERELSFWLANRGDAPHTIEEWEQNPDLGNARLDPQYRWFYYAGGGDKVPPFEPAGSEGLPRGVGPINADDVVLRGTNEQRLRVAASVKIEGEPVKGWLSRYFNRVQSSFPGVRRRGPHHDAWVRHKCYLRKLAEPNPNLVRDAEWTALLWSRRFTPTDIARAWRHPPNGQLPRQYPELRKWGQPDKMVLMAARRFAASIDLTMK